MAPPQKSGQLAGSVLELELINGRHRPSSVNDGINLDCEWINSNHSPSSTWVFRSYFSRSICRGREITTANYNISNPNNFKNKKLINPINTSTNDQMLIISPGVNNDASNHIHGYDSLSDSCSSSNEGSTKYNSCNSQSSYISLCADHSGGHGLSNYINYKLSDNGERVIMQASHNHLDDVVNNQLAERTYKHEEDLVNRQINVDYYLNDVINYQDNSYYFDAGNRVNGSEYKHQNNREYIKNQNQQINDGYINNQAGGDYKNGSRQINGEHKHQYTTNDVANVTNHGQINDGYQGAKCDNQMNGDQYKQYQNRQINNSLDQINVKYKHECVANYNYQIHGKQSSQTHHKTGHLKINTTGLEKMKRVTSWSQYLMSPDIKKHLTNSPKPQQHSKCGHSAEHQEHQPVIKSQNSEEKMRRATSWSDEYTVSAHRHVDVHSKCGQSEHQGAGKDPYQMLDMSDLLLGQRFASGTYSRLYCGQYKGSEVAVKILRKVDDDDTVCRLLEKQFRTEVDILSRLRNPNVIKFFGACEKPQVYCIVTEFVANGSLRRYLNNRRPELMPLQLITNMALDIARGMEYIHSQGIIHRDLKSENLLVTPTHGIKIADFGVARVVTEANQFRRRLTSSLHKSRSSPNLTASPARSPNVIVGEDDDGIVAGTYRWMAPEIVSGKQFSRKSDVYSFGIVMWEMLTGHVPFETLSPVQAAYRVVHKNERPPLPMSCPGDLAQLIHQCWASDPIKRPEFSEIVEILEDITDNSASNCHDFMQSSDLPNMPIRKSSTFNHIYRPTNPLLSCFTSCNSTTLRRRFSEL